MMIYHAMGMNIRHEGDFCIDRPNGSGDNLLLIFKTNALVFLDGGWLSVPPDSAILYSRTAKQLYRTCGESYVNHFLHMDCCEEDDFHQSSGLEFNRLFRLRSAAPAEELLRMIGREEMSDSPNREKYIDMLIKMLILKLADSASESGFSSPLTRHSAAMNALRAEIYSNSGQLGSVEELAKRLNLSPSHFQQLYRAQFGVSCYEDLLSARIKTAQYYLSGTNLSIKEIAGLCGYENDVCFMRRFKQRMGITPSEYRRKG